MARDQKSGATGCLARVAVAECKLEHPDGQNTGMPEGPQVPFRAGVSSLPMSKDDAGVDASEAESIRNRVLYRHAPGLPGDEVDALRGRVTIFEIESGRRAIWSRNARIVKMASAPPAAPRR